jgi:hypothetical protein
MAAIVCAVSDDGALLHFPLLPIKSGASISLNSTSLREKVQLQWRSAMWNFSLSPPESPFFHLKIAPVYNI